MLQQRGANSLTESNSSDSPADHLSLARILSNVPHLVPSHKVTFFLSRDPLSPAYEERSVSLRTEQAFVEHHLFVLLPTWLEAVKQGEWERLQAALRGDDEVSGVGLWVCEPY